MADSHMTKLRSLIDIATNEASKSRSTNVEAEHLLLALSSRPSSAAGNALAQQGLSYDTLQEALEAEQHSSLRSAGVEPIAEQRLLSTRRRRRPGWGASAKESLRRGSLIGRKFKHRKMEESDLLLGILHAELGTVPRALTIAGIDRAQLIRSLESSR
ncbi:MAG: Clp protease N-terminal domain-containing protein [Actinomycetota bacterium]|nr:Clp protease N-terminal domain-containing protein [Actinomycetota bacterium]